MKDPNIVLLSNTLMRIQDYLDSPNIDIGLTEYSNISRLINYALREVYEKQEDCESN